MKFKLALIFYFLSYFAFTQNDKEITLVDNLHGDHFYTIKIGEFSPTTMYLHFSQPDIPDYTHIYARSSFVSGWYLNENKEKVKLLGILWDQSYMTLYGPENTNKLDEYSIEEIGYDSVQLYLNKKPISFSEKFELSDDGGIFTKNGVTKKVTGLNFYEKYLDRDIFLKISNYDDFGYVNIEDLLILALPSSKNELVGMNGWAETQLSLEEYSFIEDGINILISISQIGSCNTDRNSLIGIKINKLFEIEEFETHEIGNCKRYTSHQNKKGDPIRIIKYFDSPNDYFDTSNDIGSFVIIDSKIIIIKAWE